MVRPQDTDGQSPEAGGETLSRGTISAGAGRARAGARAPACLLATLVLACVPVYQPPIDEAVVDPTTPAPAGSTTTTTTSPDEPGGSTLRFDIPYPDPAGGAGCEQQALGEPCQGGCGFGTVTPVCDIPALAAPAPFHPLLRDCACGQVIDVVLADLDGDGIDDIAAACRGPARVGVWFGSGARPLACPTLYPVVDAPNALIVADLDGDGHVDLLTRTEVYDGDESRYSLLRGRGDRTFAPHEIVFAPPSWGALTVADLDDDGDPDLVNVGARDLRVLLGDGQAGFTVGQHVALGPSYCLEGHVQDLDGDGHLDVVVVCDRSVVVAHRGGGDGSFADPGEVLVTSDTSLATVAIGDFTGDLVADLLLVGQGELTLAVGDADQQFAAPVPVGPALPASAIAGVDLDGAPGLEIVVHGADEPRTILTSSRTWLLAGDGLQGFAVVAELDHDDEVPPPVFGDFNGDGRVDLVFGAGPTGLFSRLLLLESAP